MTPWQRFRLWWHTLWRLHRAVVVEVKGRVIYAGCDDCNFSVLEVWE